EGCTMGQVLHGSATTTEAIRRTIQHSQASLRALAQRYGINPKTVAKSENRGRYDRTTTAGVRLDEGKPPSSSLACPSVSPFWLSPGRLRPNLVAAELQGPEDHSNRT